MTSASPPSPPLTTDWGAFLSSIVVAVLLLFLSLLGVVACMIVPTRTSHLIDRFRPSVRLTAVSAAAFIISAACNATGFVREWRSRGGSELHGLSEVKTLATSQSWYYADFSPAWLASVWRGHQASAVAYLFAEAAATVAWACVWPSVANLALACGGVGQPGTRLLGACFAAALAVSVLGLVLQAAMASLMERLHNGSLNDDASSAKEALELLFVWNISQALWFATLRRFFATVGLLAAGLLAYALCGVSTCL